MFVALEIREQPVKGIFDRLLNIITRPNVELELRQVRGVRYIAACAERGRRGIHWEMLLELCGRYLDRMLLPQDLQPPDDVVIPVPAIPRFERQVLISTACELIERTKMPMYRRVLGLIDPTGEQAGHVSKLLHHFTSLHVFTDNLEKYGTVSEDLMEELGAPVLFSDQPGILQDCVLVLSPKSHHARWEERLPCPVMAGGAFLTATPCDCISRLEVSPPYDLAQACPPGVPPHLFLGALYEFCGADDLPLVADTMLHNQRRTDLAEVARLVMTQAGYGGALA